MDRRSKWAWHLLPALSMMVIICQIYGADQVNLTVVLVDAMKDLSIPFVFGALVVTLFGLGQTLGSPFIGPLSKRLGYRTCLVLGGFAFSLFTLLTSYSSSFWDLAIYRIGLGVSQSIWNVTGSATIGTLFTQRRGLANAAYGLNYNIGLLWGAPLAATLLAYGGWRTPFYALGLVGIVLTIIFIFLSKAISVRLTKEIAGKVPEREQPIRRNIVISCCGAFLFAFCFFSIIGLYPTYLRVELGFTANSASIAMSIATLVLCIFALPVLALSDRIGRKWFLYCTSLLLALSVFGLFHLPTLDFKSVAGMAFLFGVGGSGGFSLLISHTQDSVPASRIGFYMGLIWCFTYLGTTFSSPVIGYIVSLWGWGGASYWLIACCLAWFILTIFSTETRLVRSNQLPTRVR